MKRLVALALPLALGACINSPVNFGGAEDLAKIREDLAKIQEEQAKTSERLAALEKRGPVLPAPGQRPPAPPLDPSKVFEIAPGSSPVRGESSAPVTLVEFSDYQCPFCSQLEPTLRQVLDSMKGKVRLVYKHFPLEAIHPMAKPAALAAIAAGEQGKFWEMHDALMANQSRLSEDVIKEQAQRIGLDMGKFEADRKAPKAEEILKADQSEAQKAEVRGTPSLYLNGKRVGDRSPEGLKKAIEEEAAGKPEKVGCAKCGMTNCSGDCRKACET